MFRTLITYTTFIILLIATACTSATEQGEWQLTPDSLRHASLFTISRADSFVLVTVKNAWREGETLHQYILVADTAPMPKRYPEGTVLRTPLRRTIMHNAVHAALTAELGWTASIAGICDIEYLQTPFLRQLVENGYIADAGSSVQSDVEHYISLRADAVFTAPLEHANYGVLEKVGIPIVECADYMETSALGRAEWIRFFGLLFGCEEYANDLFEQVEKNYTAICDTVKTTTHRPRLMTDMMNGGTWYMPGGNSYLGKLYADAGADYIVANDNRSGSVPLDFETTFSIAADADFWIIKQARPHALTYRELKHENPSYASFRPWKEGKIYFCNTLTTDFYERLPYHPDELLRELVYLLHPETAPSTHEASYFLPLE